MIIRRKERREKKRKKERKREREREASSSERLSASEESAREGKSARVSAVNGAIFVEWSSAHSATCGSTCVTYRRLADR
jgi:hypothetical protein